MMETEVYFRHVIDKCIDFLTPPYVYSFFPEEMLDKERSPNPEFGALAYWKPVPSRLTTEEFAEYEKRIGYPLPLTYRQFLSYKYFCELNFGHSCEFFKYTPNWINDNYEEITSGLWREAWDSGLIPFARDRDTGFFCFDARKPVLNADYEIVTWDPAFEAQFHCENFLELVKEMEASLDEWKLARQSM